MKPKYQRLILLVTGLFSIIAASIFILQNFRDNLVFFYSPTDLLKRDVASDKIIRVGGLVKDGSVVKQGVEVEFFITDLQNDIKIRYKGMLPPLFREGQGMVARGKLNETKDVLVADNLLTKHDEKYMPAEVAKALKKSGQWKPEK